MPRMGNHARLSMVVRVTGKLTAKLGKLNRRVFGITPSRIVVIFECQPMAHQLTSENLVL